MSHIFFFLLLPVAGILVVGTLFFICHHYHSIVVGTSCGNERINWPSDSIIDMIWKTPYVAWLVLCSTGPAIIIGSLLAKQFGFAGYFVSAFCFWLIFPISQLSSLFASSIWMPFTPVTLRKMIGKPGATLGFYLLSFGVTAFGVFGFWLAFVQSRLGLGGSIAGAMVLAISWFMYARLVGRLAFSVSFVGVEERPEAPDLPMITRNQSDGTYSNTLADPLVNAKVKANKKKPKEFVQTSQRKKLKTKDAEDGTGYDVSFADEPAPVEEEPEKEFVPPTFAWEDEPATAYDALPPEVDMTEALPKKTFEVKESEMKLISTRDIPNEPKRTWTTALWLDFVADQNTIAHFGIAVIWLIFDSLFIGFLVKLA